MISTAYTTDDLKKMVKDETASVKKSGGYRWIKVNWWGIMVHENGASLSITFEVPNALGGSNPSVTTRSIAL